MMNIAFYSAGLPSCLANVNQWLANFHYDFEVYFLFIYVYLTKLHNKKFS